MSNIRRYAALLVALMVVALMVVAIGVPSAWAYNSQSSGVAYSDPEFTTMYVSGAARVGGALTLGSTAVTSTGAELNLLNDQIASMTTAATPATGSCGAQFVFRNAAGSAIGSIRGMTCYLSTGAGAITTGTATMSVLTNGSLVELVDGRVALAQATSAGLLGITLESAATGSHYISFVLPNGGVLTSSVLTVN